MTKDVKRNIFSVLSAVFFILTVVTYEGGFNDFFLNFSPYSLAAFGILGLLFALFSIKGPIRILLIILNSLALLIFLFAVLIAIFGFKEP